MPTTTSKSQSEGPEHWNVGCGASIVGCAITLALLALLGVILSQWAVGKIWGNHDITEQITHSAHEKASTFRFTTASVIYRYERRHIQDFDFDTLMLNDIEIVLQVNDRFAPDSTPNGSATGWSETLETGRGVWNDSAVFSYGNPGAPSRPDPDRLLPVARCVSCTFAQSRFIIWNGYELIELNVTRTGPDQWQSHRRLISSDELRTDPDFLRSVSDQTVGDDPHWALLVRRVVESGDLPSTQ